MFLVGGDGDTHSIREVLRFADVHSGDEGFGRNMHHSDFVFCLGSYFLQLEDGVFMANRNDLPKQGAIRQLLENVVMSAQEINPTT